jgi:hypothetical protein
MHNLLKSRKAQFFILSAFVIVTVIYFISRWIEPYTVIDTSSVVLMEEPFIFNNIKEKAFVAVNESKSCEDLKYNLEEYKYFVESYALAKGYNLDFNYTSSPCYDEPPFFPVIIEVKMLLKSSTKDLRSNFTLQWTPY